MSDVPSRGKGEARREFVCRHSKGILKRIKGCPICKDYVSLVAGRTCLQYDNRVRIKFSKMILAILVFEVKIMDFPNRRHCRRHDWTRKPR